MKKVVLVLGLVLVLVSCSSDDSIECDGKYVTYWEEVLNDNGNISYMAVNVDGNTTSWIRIPEEDYFRLREESFYHTCWQTAYDLKY
tara:strand:+ start:1273 stop:1533 length:261 start_codon:yes stop_codon:yes gene_type:complete